MKIICSIVVLLIGFIIFVSSAYAVKFCSECGKVYDNDEQIFCSEDGARIREVEATATSPEAGSKVLNRGIINKSKYDYYACAIEVEINLHEPFASDNHIMQLLLDRAKKHLEKKGMRVLPRQCGIEELFININPDDDNVDKWSVSAEVYWGGDCQKQKLAAATNKNPAQLERDMEYEALNEKMNESVGQKEKISHATDTMNTFRSLFVVGVVNVKAKIITDKSVMNAVDKIIDNFIKKRNDLSIKKCGN